MHFSRDFQSRRAQIAFSYAHIISETRKNRKIATVRRAIVARLRSRALPVYAAEKILVNQEIKSERAKKQPGRRRARNWRASSRQASQQSRRDHTHTSTHTYTRKKMSESQPDAQPAGRGCSKLPNCENSAAVQPVARSRDLSPRSSGGAPDGRVAL